MALALAQAALSLRQGCHPYPPVGVVLVQNGEARVRAHNGRPGHPHAEVEAIQMAREKDLDLADCILYTNLEPCANHNGLVHACTQEIIDAGIPEVHISITDPYYLVRGEGVADLVTADIEVVVGEMANETRHLLRKYIHRFCPHCGWPTEEE